MMASRLRRQRKKKYIAIASVVTLAVTGAGVFYWFSFKPNQEVNSVEDQSVVQVVTEQSKILVLVTQTEILAGTEPQAYHFMSVEMNEDDVPADAVKDSTQLYGNVVKVGIQGNQVLLKSQLISKEEWFDGDQRLVEHNFTEGAIPTTIAENSLAGKYVDIMLFKQMDDDNLVVAKAAVISQSGNKLLFKLNPEQIEYLKEAATEGSLYLEIYLDSSQPAAEVTYTPAYLLESGETYSNEEATAIG